MASQVSAREATVASTTYAADPSILPAPAASYSESKPAPSCDGGRAAAEDAAAEEKRVALVLTEKVARSVILLGHVSDELALTDVVPATAKSALVVTVIGLSKMADIPSSIRPAPAPS